ncbi:hypothetical protein [Geodermatophilus sp. URMC 62]|uniref:hypothetical protein n=1 Tax=Geodermatophilus sp. URMC 62 TaxID=3423414 RepID=UPI00406C035B
MPAHSPEARALVASIAAHSSWARTADPAARTANARQALAERFEREADPDGVLPAAERARRAEHLRSAHYKRMALKSAQARRQAADARKGAAR